MSKKITEYDTKNVVNGDWVGKKISTIDDLTPEYLEYATALHNEMMQLMQNLIDKHDASE